MGKEKKKGSSGAAVSFITRNAALKKLQLPLSEFRRICILKGVFPRDPKKTLKGRNKTYYFTKDIIFLLHDPLVQKFRSMRILKRKVKTAQAKNDPAAVERLRKNMPRYTIDHIVKERYPRFVDALQDLDDALSMAHAFSRLPNSLKVKGSRIQECQRLVREFDAYIAHSQSLRKVFISIKGIYYQAEIVGQTVTWLTPHRHQPVVSREVDLKVMTHFTEFYQVMLRFVNQRLYFAAGLRYPPALDTPREHAGAGIDALVLQLDQAEAAGQLADPSAAPAAASSSQPTAVQMASRSRIATLDPSQLLSLDSASADAPTADDTSSSAAATAAADDDTFADARPAEERSATIFRGLKVFLSREVPHEALSLVIRSGGGHVAVEDLGGDFAENDPDISHQVVDRASQSHQFLSRQYVQPQWIFDSFNERFLLPTEAYAPGAVLPPHLSPFVDDANEGYTPGRREQLERLKQGMLEQPLISAEEIAAANEAVDDADDDNADDDDADEEVDDEAAEGEEQAADDDEQEVDEQGDDDDDEEIKEEEVDYDAPAAFDDLDDEEAQHQQELQAERAGVEYKARPLKRSADKIAEEQRSKKEADQLPHIMMGKKQKWLYDRMQHGIKAKQNANARLLKKRLEVHEEAKRKALQAARAHQPQAKKLKPSPSAKKTK